MNKVKRGPRRKDSMIVCPFCGCDAWHIGSLWTKCFLCKATFGGKNLFAREDVSMINRELRAMKKVNEDFEEFFGGWFDELTEGHYDNTGGNNEGDE